MEDKKKFKIRLLIILLVMATAGGLAALINYKTPLYQGALRLSRMENTTSGTSEQSSRTGTLTQSNISQLATSAGPGTTTISGATLDQEDVPPPPPATATAGSSGAATTSTTSPAGTVRTVADGSNPTYMVRILPHIDITEGILENSLIVKNDPAFTTTSIQQGATDAVVASFLLENRGSADKEIILVGFKKTGGATPTAELATEHITNFKLFREGLQIGDTLSILRDGTHAIWGNSGGGRGGTPTILFTVPAGRTITLQIKASIRDEAPVGKKFRFSLEEGSNIYGPDFTVTSPTRFPLLGPLIEVTEADKPRTQITISRASDSPTSGALTNGQFFTAAKFLFSANGRAAIDDINKISAKPIEGSDALALDKIDKIQLCISVNGLETQCSAERTFNTAGTSVDFIPNWEFIDTDALNQHLLIKAKLKSDAPAGKKFSLGIPDFNEIISSSLGSTEKLGTPPAWGNELTVASPAAPEEPFDFSLTTEGSRTVTQGNTVTNTITASLLTGTTRSLNFAVAGLPTGSNGTFSLPSCSPTCQTTLTIETGTSTTQGVAIVNITASAPGISKTTSFSLTVNAAAPVTPQGGNFDFAISNEGNQTVTAGESAANVISTALVSGTSAPVTFAISGLPTGASSSFQQGACSPTCHTTVNITTPKNTPVGLRTITITASGNGVSKSTSFGLTVNAPPQEIEEEEEETPHSGGGVQEQPRETPREITVETPAIAPMRPSAPELSQTQRLRRAPERANTGPEALIYVGIIAAIQGGMWLRKKLRK